MSLGSLFFKREEFACKCGCGFDVVDVELLDALEDVRYHFDAPVKITGPNRCAAHNATIPGAEPKSQHTLGKAVDFKVIGVHEDEVADYLEEQYPNTYGIGRYRGRTHLDVRETKARWDKRVKDV